MRTITAMVAFMSLFGVAQAEAQRGAISGTVTDTTGMPLVYAQVSFPKAGGGHWSGDLTDSTGHFEIQDVPEGDPFLIVTLIGFLSDTVRVSALTDPHDVHFKLIPRFTEFLGSPFQGGYTEPEPFDGPLVIAFVDRSVQAAPPREVRLLIHTQREFDSVGHLLAADITRTGHATRVDIGGVRHPIGWRRARPAPAVLDTAIVLSPDGMRDTLEVRYQGRTDRYLLTVNEQERRLRIERVEATFTSVHSNEVELIGSGTVRLQCKPHESPPDVCEAFLAEVVPLMPSAEEITYGWHDPDERWAIVREAGDADVDTLVERARLFTEREDRRDVFVFVHRWDGVTLFCTGGVCNPAP